MGAYSQRSLEDLGGAPPPPSCLPPCLLALHGRQALFVGIMFNLATTDYTDIAVVERSVA